MNKFYKSVCTPSIFEVRTDGTVWVRERMGWAKLDNTGAALGWWKEISASEAADYGKENVSTETPKPVEDEWPKKCQCGHMENLHTPHCAAFSCSCKAFTPAQAEAIIRGEKPSMTNHPYETICCECGHVKNLHKDKFGCDVKDCPCCKFRPFGTQPKPNWRPIDECDLKDDEWLIAGRFVKDEWNTSKATQRQYIPLNVWTHVYQIPPPPETEGIETLDEYLSHETGEGWQAVNRFVEALKQGKVKL